MAANSEKSEIYLPKDKIVTLRRNVHNATIIPESLMICVKKLQCMEDMKGEKDEEEI